MLGYEMGIRANLTLLDRSTSGTWVTSLLYLCLKWREANDFHFDKEFTCARSWSWSFVNYKVGVLLFDPCRLVAHLASKSRLVYE